MKHSIEIPDGTVHISFSCPDMGWLLDCKSPETATVSPRWIVDNGTPICGNCGEDMEYQRTYILLG